MTSNPHDADQPGAAPRRPDTCKPVYPHSYLKVNTIFEVARAAGLRDRVVGQAPGLRDPRRPVRHRRDGPFHPGDQQQRAGYAGPATTGRRQRSDPAVRRATRCRRSSTRSTASTTAARTKVGTPAIFGMNFQTVSTARSSRLRTARPAATWPTASLPDRCSPRARLRRRSIGTMVAEINAARARRTRPRSSCRPSTASPPRPGRADPHPRRPDHHRDQRRVGRAHPGQGELVAGAPTTTGSCSG